MSSISRRRNGLMALSVIGAPVLGAVFSPSISRQDACFCYSPRPFPCYRLPPERFSPPTLTCRYSERGGFPQTCRSRYTSGPAQLGVDCRPSPTSWRTVRTRGKRPPGPCPTVLSVSCGSARGFRRSSRYASGDLDAFLVAAQLFEAVLQYFKRVPGDVEAPAKVDVALFDAPPRLLLGAGDPIEARLGADRGDLRPQGIALPARPTTEIEHDCRTR